MSPKQPKRGEQERLLDAALEFIKNAPEDEFDELLKESGDNPAELEKRGQGAFEAAFKRYGEYKRQAMKDGVAHLKKAQSAVSLPQGREELLDLAHKLFMQRIQAGHVVSLQHRELSELTDEDLRKTVAHLQALIAASKSSKKG